LLFSFTLIPLFSIEELREPATGMMLTAGNEIS
jgi:hypothetical protein